MIECSGCSTVSEDGFKPSCRCATMVGIDENHQQVWFLDPAKRDAMAKIICRYLTGETVSANGSHGFWLCPTDDEAANSMCAEIATRLMNTAALTDAKCPEG